MSTRSGKRIHNYLKEHNDQEASESVYKSDVKTRSKKQKENEIDIEVTVPKKKKRANYVSYPSNDEDASEDTVQLAVEAKKSRKSRKHALKDHNKIETAAIDSAEDNAVDVKVGRLTRRNKQCNENVNEENTETNCIQLNSNNGDVQSKKHKKSKHSSVAEVQIKKGKKKKKGSKGKHNQTSRDGNKSTTSIDSFHSAAGSPMRKEVKETIPENLQLDNVKTSKDTTNNKESEKTSNLSDTCEKKSNKRKKSSTVQADVYSESNSATDLKATFDNDDVKATSDTLNNTFNKDTSRNSKRRSTKTETEVLNSTFDKKIDGSDTNTEDEKLNSTFVKSDNNDSKPVSLNSTYDKESNSKLDSTFDKSDKSKKSLTSSDNTLNVTFDKSTKHISIGSDDSNTENIVNTTPVLIESSMDESDISEKSATVAKSATSEYAPAPLKREGTFTKSGPEAPTVSEKTPTKSVSLPAPGNTPFHENRKSNQRKSMLNVTRSIEKPTRRSSMADLAPRQTRVMFCSPGKTGVLNTAQKKTIIKSSMKGSNKSFVFDESVSDTARPGSRKRSLTHNAADEVGAKRKRRNDSQTAARHRTQSAIVKPTHTPTKATPQPKSEARPARTKLPDFAALHQRRFAKMESLDECQLRKAQRARVLLTPKNKTGERLSRGKSVDVAKPAKEIPKPTNKTSPAKPKVPTFGTLQSGFTRFGFKLNIGVNPFSSPAKKENAPKENKPNGLTRQASQSKIEGTTRKEVAKQTVIREKSFSTAGKTIEGTTRKEIAKQTIMREKSFSTAGKREEKRKANRTVIKGVRTNRRFELQMQMRNVN